MYSGGGWHVSWLASCPFYWHCVFLEVTRHFIHLIHSSKKPKTINKKQSTFNNNKSTWLTQKSTVGTKRAVSTKAHAKAREKSVCVCVCVCVMLMCQAHTNILPFYGKHFHPNNIPSRAAKQSTKAKLLSTLLSNEYFIEQ
jgi:hypothetical protein